MAENIKVIIRERRAQVEGGPVIVCGNSDYTITFDFDSDWNLTGPKTARFVYVKGGEVLHEDKVFSGQTVAVPVLSDVSFVDVGVFAGDLCTTTPARIRCKKSILCGSGEIHEPTPDVYAQIMALFNEMAEQGAFGATEAQAQQIEANKTDIAALKSGTGKAGLAADAEKLGGETAEAWQSKIKDTRTDIQTDISEGSIKQISVGKEGMVLYPAEGSKYFTSANGKLRITLPKSDGNNCVVCFDVTLGRGGSGRAVYTVGFRHMSDISVSGPSVYSVGTQPYANLPVVIGTTGTNIVIIIGDDNTSFKDYNITISNIKGVSFHYRQGWGIAATSDNSDVTTLKSFVTPWIGSGFATVADLANYLLHTGGLAKNLQVGVQEFLGQSGFAFNCNGTIKQYLSYDDAADEFKKWSADGIAKTLLDTGNMADYVIPPSGGAFNAGACLSFKATDTGGNAVGDYYANSDGSVSGGIGMYSSEGVGKWLYLAASATPYNSNHGLTISPTAIKWMNNDVLHTGNSAAVKIQSAAPTDGLWVW